MSEVRMPKQIGAVGSHTDSEGLLIHWVSNLYGFSPSGFPQIFLFPHFNCSSILSHDIKLHSPVLCGHKLPPFVLRSTALWHWARALSFESTLGSFFSSSLLLKFFLLSFSDSLTLFFIRAIPLVCLIPGFYVYYLLCSCHVGSNLYSL